MTVIDQSQALLPPLTEECTNQPSAFDVGIIVGGNLTAACGNEDQKEPCSRPNNAE